MIKFFKATNLYNYLLTFILLAVSGNPLFISNQVYVALTIALAMAIVAKMEITSLSKFFFYILPFLGIFAIQVIAFSNAKISSALFVIMKIFIGFSLFFFLGKKFVVTYINLMFIISIISLIGFLYNRFLGYLPGFPISEISTSLVLYTELFDPITGFIGRNSGMFWEPGAFEGYLNLAMCFIAISKEISYRTIKFLVLTIALLTTYSTTGYIVFSFIIIGYLLGYSNRPIMVRILLLILFILIASVSYQSLDFLQQKIQNQATLSYFEEGRINDYKRFSPIIQENFFTGITADTMADLGITNSGNGFLGFFVRFGIFGVLFYFTFLFLKLLRSIGLFSAGFLFMVVLLTLQGEAFLLYPLYLALPFLEMDRGSIKTINTINTI